MATKGKWAKKEYETKDHHQELTDKLIAKMEESKALNWEKPWFTCNELPYNPVTGTRYKGVNVMSLMASGFDDPRFLTFKGVQELAEKTGKEIFVKKGAKGTPVFKAVNVVFKDGGEDTGETEIAQPGAARSFWKMVYAGTVFNASQIEGMEPHVARENKVVDQTEVNLLTEALKSRTGLSVVHSELGRAYYSPAEHKVHMPEPSLFKSTSAYFDTLLHEFGHSTGPALKRDMSGGKGSDSYAKEELVAELSSVFMAAELGLAHDPKSHDNHAAYLESWLSALKGDKNFIFQASSKASKACEFQLDHLKEHKQELELRKDWILEKVIAANKEPEQTKTMSMAM